MAPTEGRVARPERRRGCSKDVFSKPKKLDSWPRIQTRIWFSAKPVFLKPEWIWTVSKVLRPCYRFSIVNRVQYTKMCLFCDSHIFLFTNSKWHCQCHSHAAAKQQRTLVKYPIFTHNISHTINWCKQNQYTYLYSRLNREAKRGEMVGGCV